MHNCDISYAVHSQSMFSFTLRPFKAIAVLLNCNNAASGGSKESSYSSYYQYINEAGAVRLSCAETHRMPGRIRGIDALAVEERSEFSI